MSQQKSVKTLLERFHMSECNPSPVPVTPGSRMLRMHCPAVPNKEQTKLYQQIVGGLMYAVTFTHPDISHSVNQCAKFMSNPGQEHINAAKMILKYLAGTKHLKLTYQRSNA
eukprot:3746935-Rhodomonas_salina.1